MTKWNTNEVFLRRIQRYGIQTHNPIKKAK